VSLSRYSGVDTAIFQRFVALLKNGAQTVILPSNFVPISAEQNVDRGDVVTITNIKSKTIITTNLQIITVLPEGETDEKELQVLLEQAKLNAQSYKQNNPGQQTVITQAMTANAPAANNGINIVLTLPQLSFLNFPGYQFTDNENEYVNTVVGVGHTFNPAGKKVVHHICFDYASGYSDRLIGVSFSFVNHKVGEFMLGYMASVIINEGGAFNIGAMHAGIGNITAGYMMGNQMAGVYNMVGNDFTGFQAAGVFNRVKNRMLGMQAAGVFNEAGGSVGMQAAGIFNTAEAILGVQAAGVFNKSRDMNGLQAAGVFNMAVGVMNGLQVAGVVNMAGDLNGGQIGVVNVVAGTVNGFQIGVLNISDEMNGIPIGLINISKNGYNRIQAWYDETSFMNVGFTLGTRYIYNSFSVGVNTAGNRMTLGLGLGLHLPMNGCYINMEGDFQPIAPLDKPLVIFTEGQNVNSLIRIKLGFGVELGSSFALFAGVSYTLFVPASEIGIPGAATYDEAVYPSIGQAAEWVNFNIRSWPGFYVGLEF